MTKMSQKRAVANNRRRLKERGMSRYEVRGLDVDRDLLRSLAKRLAEGGASAGQLRADVSEKIASGQAHRGGLLAILRRSPLVGANLRIKRKVSHGRAVRL